MDKTKLLSLETLAENYPCICFDFDGLLVDTESIHYAAYKKTIENFGGTFPLTFKEYTYLAHHPNRMKLANFAYRHCSELPSPWQEVRKHKMKVYSELLETIEIALLPGVEETMRYFKQRELTMCVVTNSLAGDVDTIKRRIPALSLIPNWITKDQYENPKPAPDGYLMALHKLGFSAKDAVGFEDTPRGLRSLEETGIFPILVCPGDHPGLDDLDSVVHFSSFQELLPTNTTT